MKRCVVVKFEKRPEELGIIWSHSYAETPVRGVIKPGYVVSARCNGLTVYLKILDADCADSITGRVIRYSKPDACHSDLLQFFETDHVLKLSMVNVFSCQQDESVISELAETVLLDTQNLELFELE